MKNMKLVNCLFLILTVQCYWFSVDAQTIDLSNVVHKKVLVTADEITKINYVNTNQLHYDGWDTLAQPKFWQQIIQMSADSMLVNVANLRKPLNKVCTKDWNCQCELDKDAYKDSLKALHELDYDQQLYVTVGKHEFYEIRKAIPEISDAVDVFVKNDVDPWYAQTILLIESPGKFHATSSVGARGPFQLMPYVARKYGLKVTKKVDERTDIDRAAYAASQLLGRAWIPMTKRLLDTMNIPYNETDLWFRLLVLHSYHAGMGNVKAVLEKINPTHGGMELIQTMWQTEAKGFKNQSQNYSQIALASLLIYDKILHEEKDTLFLIQGDRYWSLFKTGRYKVSPDEMLKLCMKKYESDLVDGVISANYFLEKTNMVRDEMYNVHCDPNNVAYNPYNENDLNSLGNQLLKKRNVDDAIKVFELSANIFPSSVSALDSLGSAYRMAGQSAQAQKIFLKSAELKKNSTDKMQDH